MCVEAHGAEMVGKGNDLTLCSTVLEVADDQKNPHALAGTVSKPRLVLQVRVQLRELSHAPFRFLIGVVV